MGAIERLSHSGIESRIEKKSDIEIHNEKVLSYEADIEIFVLC